METIKKEVGSFLLLPDSFVFKEGKMHTYTKGDIVLKSCNLPFVDASNMQKLKNLGISFRVKENTKDVLEIYDGDFSEKIENRPLYVYQNGNFVFSRFEKFSIVDPKAIVRAETKKKFLDRYDDIVSLISKLEGEEAVVIDGKSSVNGQIKFKGKTFFIFSCKPDVSAIFDLSRISRIAYLKIISPNITPGEVIGKGGKQIRSWCTEMRSFGITYIKVVS